MKEPVGKGVWDNMFVIAGLGNPKREYDNTRHNIGFAMIDALSDKYNITVMDIRHKAMLGKGIINGQKVILAKPQTFMNLSGESLRELVNYYKIDEKQELIVIYDDISMSTGQLRIRKKGSAGGHNGIKNIITHLGHDIFLRIKIGVGEKPRAYDLVDYVLGHFTPAETKCIAKSACMAEEALRLMVRGETDAAMNRYNKKQEVENESTDKAL